MSKEEFENVEVELSDEERRENSTKLVDDMLRKLVNEDGINVEELEVVKAFNERINELTFAYLAMLSVIVKQNKDISSKQYLEDESFLIIVETPKGPFATVIEKSFDEFFDIEVKELDKDIEEKAQGIDVLLELV